MEAIPTVSVFMITYNHEQNKKGENITHIQ